MTNTTATARFAHWVEHFGLGFHPDTSGRNYVDQDGKRCLTNAQAAAYDRDMDAAFGEMDDPYDAAIQIWAKLGLITQAEAEA